MRIVIKLKDGRKMNATLDENAAPITVQNFVKLIDEKFFDGLIFHRVIPGFMIQGGGMDGAMKEKRAKSIKGEFASNGIKNPISHVPGVLSMAHPGQGQREFAVLYLRCGLYFPRRRLRRVRQTGRRRKP